MKTIERRSVILATGTAVIAAATEAAAQRAVPAAHEVQPVLPTEDLMQEHGLLERLLLIYQESARRLRTNASFPIEMLHRSATIMHDFVEEYHERSEEQHIFPRAMQSAPLVELVRTLLAQHEHGRRLNAIVLTQSNGTTALTPNVRTTIADALDAINRMYFPHLARENSVLFPAVRELFSRREWSDMGEQFEAEEHRRFGATGFEGMVEHVADVERALGIYELSGFSPR